MVFICAPVHLVPSAACTTLSSSSPSKHSLIKTSQEVMLLHADKINLILWFIMIAMVPLFFFTSASAYKFWYQPWKNVHWLATDMCHLVELNHSLSAIRTNCSRAREKSKCVKVKIWQVAVFCCVVFSVFDCVLQVEVLYGDEPLKDYYTLMDIAYFYEWRRVSGSFHTFVIVIITIVVVGMISFPSHFLPSFQCFQGFH